MPLRLPPGWNQRDIGVPAYRQLADNLRQSIVGGDVLPNEKLLSVAKLADMAGVSEIVVRQAIDILADEGWLARRTGAAPSVVDQQVREVNASRYRDLLRALLAGEDPSTSFVADHGAAWEDYSVTELEYSEQVASPRDIELLGLAEGDRVFRRRMVRCIGGKPLQIHRSAVAADLAKGNVLSDPTRQPMPGGTLAELVEVAIIPTHVVELIEPSRRPDATERRLLGMSGGDVWKVERVFYVDGRPVEASRAIAPASRARLRYETDLSLG